MPYFHSVRPSEHMLPRWTAQPIVNPLTVQSQINYIIYALYIWYFEVLGLQLFSVLHMLIGFCWVLLGCKSTDFLFTCLHVSQWWDTVTWKKFIFVWDQRISWGCIQTTELSGMLEHRVTLNEAFSYCRHLKNIKKKLKALVNTLQKVAGSAM